MIGLGTLINTGAIIVGGVAGHLFGNLIKDRHRESLQTACGISVIFIGIAGAMEGMLKTGENGGITSGKAMFLTICIALGTLIGELLNIEGLLERFGEWLKKKTGNAKDANFVNGFVTASLTVCVGAMAIVGSIQDGIKGDWSILGTKAILDLVIVMVMTASLGKGCIFSAIPVFAIQGSVTLLAVAVGGFMTAEALAYISFVGSVLIACVGINLVWGKKVRVANMIPALIFAATAAYLEL